MNEIRNTKYEIRSKKGMLLASETLKIIIAVICISFLVYLLASLYFNRAEVREREEATIILEKIKIIIPNLDLVNKTSENITNIGPSGWKIFSYTDEDEKIPSACAGQSCICICDSVVGGDYWDRQIGECSKSGVCEIMTNLIELPDIEIDKHKTSIEIYIQGAFYGVREI